MKTWRFGLVLSCFILFVGSCSKGSSSGPEVRWLIGVSQANMTEPWRLSVTSDIREEAATFPDLKVIVTDASDSAEKQAEDVDRLLGYGIDLLIISPADAVTLQPVVDKVYRKIPVIVIDRAVEGYNYSLYIGPDNRRIGQEAGKYVASLLKRKGGRVLEVLGRKDSPPSIDRSQGFREALASRPDIHLLKSLTAYWLQDRAEDALAAFFAESNRAEVVFAHNDAMAYGAWLAASHAGIRNLAILGIDGLSGTNGGIELVRRGLLAATFVCPTGGKEAIDYGVDILNHVEGIPKKIILRTSIVTQDSPDPPRFTTPRPRREGQPIVLGYSQVGAESAWRKANTLSIQEAARVAGINLLFADGDGTQATQIKAIRSFIRKKVDVIAFSPIVESGWDQVLGEARAAGIPVVLTDRKIDSRDESLWLTYIGSDFLEEGRRAATWLVKNSPLSNPIRIVEIRGTEGSAPAIDRGKGFREVLADHPEFKIVASLNGDFTTESGKMAMQNYLASPHSDFDVLFAHKDDMALGAVKTLEDAEQSPQKKTVVISVDASRLALQAEIEGKINCTVECTPLLGPQLMKIVHDYMRGKTLPYQFISSEEVFPAEKAREVLPTRKY